jgi:hypothetical protein
MRGLWKCAGVKEQQRGQNSGYKAKLARDGTQKSSIALRHSTSIDFVHRQGKAHHPEYLERRTIMCLLGRAEIAILTLRE